jgi:hypothetical protein
MDSAALKSIMKPYVKPPCAVKWALTLMPLVPGPVPESTLVLAPKPEGPVEVLATFSPDNVINLLNFQSTQLR